RHDLAPDFFDDKVDRHISQLRVPRQKSGTATGRPGQVRANRQASRSPTGRTGHRLAAKLGYAAGPVKYGVSGVSNGPIVYSSFRSGGVSSPRSRARRSSPGAI